jgi:aspartyl protease family protein
MQRYLIFAVGLLLVIAVLAPSLGNLANTTAGSGPGFGGDSGGDAGNGGVGLPMIAAPGAGSTQSGATTVASAGGGVVLMRDAAGQFRADATVDDQPVRFMIDTGADGLALSEADARGVGIMPDPATYRQVVTTASGPGYGAHVRIDRMQVAGHDLRDVDAVVVRGLGTSLLGQSVLRQLGQVTITGDRMTIGAADMGH